MLISSGKWLSAAEDSLGAMHHADIGWVGEDPLCDAIRNPMIRDYRFRYVLSVLRGINEGPRYAESLSRHVRLSPTKVSNLDIY
jgi:hypothetical protein